MRGLLTGRSLNRLQRIVVAVSALLATALIPASAVQRTQAQVAESGLVCTTGPTFTLTTTDGYINLPDGNVIYMWGYANGNGAFQHPGPVLCVNEGDTVTVILNNTLSQPVSIVFPGQEEVLANGAPAQPQFDGGGVMTSLTTVAAANGGSVTYSFVATRPGTYLYQSGTEPTKQVQMGLFGALIVRPALGANYAYNRADSRFNAGTEFIALLSEIDPYVHQAAERNQVFNQNNYRARYWLINGRAFPDTLAPNNAAWLPDQPYGALAHISPYDATTNPDPALVRYLGAGTEDYPFHPHGNNSRVIGRDGSPMEGISGEDLSFEKFSIPVGPGQTWDVTFNWTDIEQWNPLSNTVPITVPQLQNLTYGQYFSGSPYLGDQDVFPVGVTSLNECGEYYHIAHNHALQQMTSWGMTMSGMATYTRIDPPQPNACP
jgi:FtsP/CotA-like multicopper oxidase with cupredoxin domain